MLWSLVLQTKNTGIYEQASLVPVRGKERKKKREKKKLQMDGNHLFKIFLDVKYGHNSD